MDPGLLGTLGALLGEGAPSHSIAILTVPGRGIVGTAITPNGARKESLQSQRVRTRWSFSFADGSPATTRGPSLQARHFSGLKSLVQGAHGARRGCCRHVRRHHEHDDGAHDPRGGAAEPGRDGSEGATGQRTSARRTAKGCGDEGSDLRTRNAILFGGGSARLHELEVLGLPGGFSARLPIYKVT